MTTALAVRNKYINSNSDVTFCRLYDKFTCEYITDNTIRLGIYKRLKHMLINDFVVNNNYANDETMNLEDFI